VKQLLMDTAEPLDDVPLERQGAGVVNAGAAVEAALRLLPQRRGEAKKRKESFRNSPILRTSASPR